MNKLVAVILGLFTLSACATGSQVPVIETVEVLVPVDDPVCARTAYERLIDTAPDYPDTTENILNAPNVFERVKLLLAGRSLRQAREAGLLGALKTCASSGDD